MAFFEELGKKVSHTGQEAIKKTKNLADTAKLNSQIDTEEKAIKDSYSLIGKKYFEMNAGNPDENLADYVNTINEAYKKIADLREQINKIKGVEACPNCGTDHSSNVAFCAKCGFKFPEKVEAESESQPEEGKKCPHCGAELTEGSAFCTDCGQKIE